MLFTHPLRTGSPPTPAKTTGIEVPKDLSAMTGGVPAAKITFGASASSSFAKAGNRSMSPSAERTSSTVFRSST
jgi:hypothetical protein